MTCIFTSNATLLQVLFKHFASKIQPPGFYISRTLVENRLIIKRQISEKLALCQSEQRCHMRQYKSNLKKSGLGKVELPLHKK